MLAIIILLALFIYYLVDQYRQTTRLPPGPYPILFFGNIFQLAIYSWKCGGIVPGFKRIKEIYGPVFTLWLGPIPTVHIAEYSLCHEAMVRNGMNFQNRWGPAIMMEGRGDRGLIASNGHIWQEQRRFSLHVLRNLGVSRNLMEERIMNEIDLRFNEIDRLPPSSGVDPFHLFDRLVGGIINRLLFSMPVDEKEELKFYSIKKNMDKWIEELAFYHTLLKSWMFRIPVVNRLWSRTLEPVRTMKDFIKNQVRERKRAIEDGGHVLSAEPQDYTDAFLKRMRENDEDGYQNTSFDDESLVVNILDLWMAGMETTTTTLCWAMVFLMRNPEVASRVREELLEVTDGARPLSVKDRPKTPYFVATITEIQRLASILKLNIFRQAEADTEIGGYPVPRGTVVSAELCLLLNDESKFSNPDKFDPSRFIHDPSLAAMVAPFGLGRRACLGESLARAELYLIIGNILLRYSLNGVDGPPSAAEDNDFGILRKPRSFRILFDKIL
ncbi:unnamed protein product [Cylicocyclus nassatus]|uniref:Cytochrome P450 n=1 Tax=Cylicocyclus nassatus TaxID=53992 RepID=A0AA36M7L0_CYLNA|nr:unnamed protein product [Cylicocyclus nassatus]